MKIIEMSIYHNKIKTIERVRFEQEDIKARHQHCVVSRQTKHMSGKDPFYTRVYSVYAGMLYFPASNILWILF